MSSSNRRQRFQCWQERRWIDNFLIVFIALVSALYGLAGYAVACPVLQLDIEGGTYDSSTETIIAPSGSFTLYAYLIEDSKGKNTKDDWYFISAAVVPQVHSASDLGSFTFNFSTGGTSKTPLPGNGDNTIDVTGEMVYGVPPLETIAELQGWDKKDLNKHDIFETYFAEFGFQFTGSEISIYDTQDRAISGDPIPGSGTGMYFAKFTVDTSNIISDYTIHFDLYNKKLLNCTTGEDCDITNKAPFSHDAESRLMVPEPATLLLLGSGLLALGLIKRRKR